MPLLELVNVSKSSGAIPAVRNVSFKIERGEIIGSMGDNGAGKSVLVRNIAGDQPPSSGSILMDGKHVVFHNPLEARARGIEIAYQDLALCSNRTAAANVFPAVK